MTFLKSASVALFSLSAAGTALAQDRARIVTVNYPLQYFAERLVGDAADVSFPVPQDIDPSFWRPTIADISAIQAADLILLNGAGFATWIDRVSLPRSKVVNTTAAFEDRFIRTDSITHSHGEGEEHSHEGTASYVWLDPMLAIAQAEAVAAALSARGIAPAADIDAELAALRADLEELDAEARASLAAIQDVNIIATHPRYQYFAQRYGLSIASLEWEAGAMPTPEEQADLAALVDETAAQILIWEGQPPEEAFAMASDLGVRNVVFPSLAHGGDGHSFLDVFADVLQDMTSAAPE